MAAPGPRPDDIAYLTGLVRAQDRPRYYATLFAPPGLRDDLFAIYGLAAEIERIPDHVTEPALGEIRLQWWRDALLGPAERGGEGQSPAIRAAAAVIERHRLPLAPCLHLVDARSADLYSDPPATVSDLEARLGETQSALFQMAAIMAGSAGPETADAAGHAGVAYGLSRRLASFADDRTRGRTILPAALLAEGGLSVADAFSAPPAELNEPLAAMRDLALRHLRLAVEEAGALPRPFRPIFLPLATVAPVLARLERNAGGLSDLAILATIAWARVRGLPRCTPQ